MHTVLRFAHIASLATAVSLVAPAASADDLPPAPGLSSPASSNRFIDNRARNNWGTTAPAAEQRRNEAWANRPDSATASQRGYRLLSQGQDAMSDGDQASACGFFKQAHRAFAEDNIGGGISDSQDLITKTCKA